MRYTISASLIALASAGAVFYSKTSLPQVHEIVQLPNVWIENVALRSNGDLLLTAFTENKIYALNTAQSPPKPHAVVEINGVNALSGIAEVGQDVFAVTGGVFEGGSYLNNTMSLSLLKFSGNGVSVQNVFEKSKYGPVNGIVVLPHHRHIILAADSARGEILRIDTTTGHIEVAIKDDQLAAIAGGPFPAGVNGIKIFKNYLYFTNSARQSFGRVKIDKMGNKIGDIQTIAKLEGSQYAPDDFAVDEHGNAYVVFWQDRVIKITPQGKQTVIVDGLLAGPTSAVFSKDYKILYVVTSGQNDANVSGGQVVEIKL
ncbi:hypothetical protein ACHAPI_007090 [Fusarium lateritium]